MFSAAFIQYFIYAVLYCIEGAKIKEIKQAEKDRNMVYDQTGMDSNVSQGIRQQVPQQSESKNLPYEGGSDDDQTDKKNVDVGDIELEEVQH